MNVVDGQVHSASGLPADVVWHALSAYTAFYSATPVAFGAKASHFPSAIKASTAVIAIDVLRATSTLTAAAAGGASGILIEVKPATGTAFSAPPSHSGPWIFGGEQNGKAMPGGAIGNSPTEIQEGMFAGRYLKFVSTNGARAIAAAAGAGFDRVYLACIPNVEATVLHAVASGAERIAFVGGGFYEAGTLEDTVCAGMGIHALLNHGFADAGQLDDEACMAVSVASKYSERDQLLAALRNGQVGRLLDAIGRAVDIDAVVTGEALDPSIWEKMHTTVLSFGTIDGLGMFVPISFPRTPK